MGINIIPIVFGLAIRGISDLGEERERKGLKDHWEEGEMEEREGGKEGLRRGSKSY